MRNAIGLKTGERVSVTVAEDINDFAPAAWDSHLAPEDVQLCHRFVRACQDARVEDCTYRHILITDADGTVLTATLSLLSVSLDLLAFPRARGIVRRLRRRRPDFLRVPVLICGLPVSFGRPCFKVRAHVDPTRPLGLLMDVIAETSQSVDPSLLCFKEFTDHEAALLSGLHGFGFFRAASLPGCRLEILWSTFDEYLSSMRAGYRRQVRASLRARRRSGLSLRAITDFESKIPEIFALYEQVMNHAEFQLERLNRPFFQNVNDYLGAQSSAILAEHRGELLGFAIMLREGTRATFLLVGFDYEKNREHQVYPNLMVEVVRHAIETGASELELGQTSYAIKRRFGAVPTPRHLFLRHRKPSWHLALRSVRRQLFPDRQYSPRHVFRS